jgi:hypothetical protein
MFEPQKSGPKEDRCGFLPIQSAIIFGSQLIGYFNGFFKNAAFCNAS